MLFVSSLQDIDPVPVSTTYDGRQVYASAALIAVVTPVVLLLVIILKTKPVSHGILARCRAVKKINKVTAADLNQQLNGNVHKHVILSNTGKLKHT